ncbi:hypothetical protein DRP04_06605 [Archaeoglobales archaeon]|nr:MAG: hypothetical protein DRP04_06605 [Archaeoglobales archaeon]
MRSYDELEGFIDYTDENEWKRYIETYVIPLWKCSWILKEFWTELKSEFDNVPFNDVNEEDVSLILGGVTQRRDEMYTRNSLAKFYAKFFGLRLKDIQSWILQAQMGEMLTEINVEVVETEFIKFVKEVFNLLDYGLLYQQLVTDLKEPELNYRELKNDPNKVKELIKDFYQGILNISLNHNYGTFFLCSINQITYRYMKAAYPRIDECLDFLINEFGLMELEWNNPIKPDSEVFKEYTIYCFPEYNPNNKGKSFGGAICKLNDTIWEWFTPNRYYPYNTNEFRETLSMLFGEVPNLKKEYREGIKELLPVVYFDNIHYERNLMANARKVSVGGGFIERCDKLLIDIIDKNSPHLFFNMLRISKVTENYIDFSSEW